MNEQNDVGCVNQIGETAGQVWNALASVESLSLAKLIRSIDAPRDLVMQGVGWLAREGKVVILEVKRGREIALTDAEKQLANGLSLYSDAA